MIMLDCHWILTFATVPLLCGE